MQEINTRQFNRGTRSMPREINRKIMLNTKVMARHCFGEKTLDPTPSMWSA